MLDRSLSVLSQRRGARDVRAPLGASGQPVGGRERGMKRVMLRADAALQNAFSGDPSG